MKCLTRLASPFRRSQRPARTPRSLLDHLEPRTLLSAAVESIDGLGNNLRHNAWGSAGSDQLRLTPAAYADGFSTPSGTNRPSARAVSNAIAAQSTDLENDRHLSDMLYVFGQFLDHDLDLTLTGTEKFDIAIPKGDAWFDPTGTGTKTMSFTRSLFDAATGTGKGNPRQQTNAVTAFIDGSQVYGSDSTTAASLRTFTGGKMATSAGNLLPFDPATASGPGPKFFLAGDVRANENVELTSIQTLFVREHNRIATRMAADHPTWSDEQLYQAARRVVIAELQSITVNEFLPALLGPAALKPYTGYHPEVNPGIAIEFSTVAYRFGHSMLDGDIERLNNDGTEVSGGSIALRDAFFNPSLLDASLPNHEGDIDPYLKGAITGEAQEIDAKLVDDVRNFLFGPPGSGGFDLAALNIQRGRDHGIADYNSLRKGFGLPKVTSFEQITRDKTMQASLKATYGSVDNIDAWVGGLAEDHIPGGSVGPLFAAIIRDQFTRVRDGDRFWFENTFRGQELDALQHTTLGDIIRRNTTLTTVQKNVFLAPPPKGVKPPLPKDSKPPMAPPKDMVPLAGSTGSKPTDANSGTAGGTTRTMSQPGATASSKPTQNQLPPPPPAGNTNTGSNLTRTLSAPAGKPGTATVGTQLTYTVLKSPVS